MTLFCPICSKRVPSWMGMYGAANALLAKDSQGRACHKACLEFSIKDKFNKAMNLPLPSFMPIDLETCSGTELGRLRRANKYGKR